MATPRYAIRHFTCSRPDQDLRNWHISRMPQIWKICFLSPNYQVLPILLNLTTNLR
ncbi:hypothetical protein VB711_08045 [Cronbergia sp. UHCC 0137]|uniref:hypothetical protein n=1 Tax=Cronbergia sp. UHCC 0137 TaxID=3110239 RepID=UPI002B208C0C|nr:hypothetical protein [Cronbergia sp. UHCC 0137]MEA5617788.1 hypothetical protein [Cronbergia sp. UHCC 0137]